MAFSVRMPELGESVTEGTVTRWLKQEGDTVELDEPLVEISTDKVDTEIPSPAAGVLTKISAHEDDTVVIGGELALIGEAVHRGDDAAPATGATQPEPQKVDEQYVQCEAEPLVESPLGGDPVRNVAPARASTGPAEAGATTPLLLPELGESVTEGTVTRWLKQAGDVVHAGEALVEVSTDKVDTEIPSPVAGTLISVIVGEGATVAVGAELARIDGGSDLRASAADPQIPSGTQTLAATAPPAEPSAGDPAAVSGVQAEGRVGNQQPPAVAAQRDDTQVAPATHSPAAASTAGPTSVAPVGVSQSHLRGTTQKVNRIRQLTAKKTVESLRTSAQLTQVHEVDMTKVVALRAAAKKGVAQREGLNLTYLPFVARVAIDALKIYPNINASYNEDTQEITYHDAEHIGFAVDTERGLLSPVIHHAGGLSLLGLARAIADVAARARSGQIKPDELVGGTFTITNIGSQGALFDTPILVPPQGAMLATGAIIKRPRVVSDTDGGESIGLRSVCYLSLTYDHRLIDGADAGRFLSTLKRRLEEGAFEAELGL